MILGEYDKKLGEAYVKEYLRLFPQRADSIKAGCESCYRDAYNRLLFHQNKTTTMATSSKYQFLGKEGKEYNFPRLGIFALTTATFNDTIGEKLLAACSALVKKIEAKAAKEDK